MAIRDNISNLLITKHDDGWNISPFFAKKEFPINHVSILATFACFPEKK
jgi:hypothetical protein